MEHRPNIEEPEHSPASSAEARGDSHTPTDSPEAHQLPQARANADFMATAVRAGFWLRFVAFTIDTVILSCFSLLLLLVGVLMTSLESYGSGLDADTEEFVSLFPLWIAGVMTTAAAYFTILHCEYGQTIGKSLLGLEVRMRDGALPSYSQALVRWLAYGVSAAFCGLGFLWIGLNPGKRGWHDLLTSYWKARSAATRSITWKWEIYLSSTQGPWGARGALNYDASIATTLPFTRN
jgi:uncharacterized RDD family membrane protein YckC